MKSFIVLLFLLAIVLISAFTANADGAPFHLSADSLAAHTQVWIDGGWTYHPGDDAAWADPGFDDSGWKMVDPRLTGDLMPADRWPGLGWFRISLDIDSTLMDRPLGLYMWQGGASDIYLDGDLLYRFGTVAATREKEVHFWERTPKSIRFHAGASHLLAVRYSNHSFDFIQRNQYAPGFGIAVGDLDRMVAARMSRVRNTTMYKWVFMTVPFMIALLHILLFLYRPKAKDNLFFAVTMIGVSCIIFFNFQPQLTGSFVRSILYNKLFPVAILFTTLFGLITTSWSVNRDITRRLLLSILLALALGIAVFLRPSRHWTLIIYIVSLLGLAEMLRLMFSKPVRSAARGETAIIGTGLITLFLSFIYQFLIAYGIVPPIGGFYLVYPFGILALIISMSVSLARDVAITAQNLEKQLVHVRELSEKNLAQERQAKDQEISRRLLEADNTRKTLELEEARQFQLAMLPQCVSHLPGLDICLSMKTATEVGGDYYDYLIGEDGTTTIAIGDATGHGMKAGTMVASVKSLFHALGAALDMPDFFNRCNTIIRRMGMGNMYMALMVVRIENRTLTASSAGMPPIFIRRSATRTVEEILMKGMPLGGTETFPYELRRTDLEPGDTVLLMSDGYPELFDETNDMLDYHRVKEIFGSVAPLAPDDIVRHLYDAGEAWRKERTQEDDITFVVLKVTENL